MTYPTHARLTPAHIMLPSRINDMHPLIRDEIDWRAAPQKDEHLSLL